MNLLIVFITSVSVESDGSSLHATRSLRQQKQILDQLTRIYKSVITDLSVHGMSRHRLPVATAFDLEHKWPGDIVNYMNRINKYLFASDTIWIIAAIYVSRLESKGVHLSSRSMHAVIGICFMTAQKAGMGQDEYYSDEYYACVLGLTLSDLKQLERRFLLMMQWTFYVSANQFWFVRQHLLSRAVT